MFLSQKVLLCSTGWHMNSLLLKCRNNRHKSLCLTFHFYVDYSIYFNNKLKKKAKENTTISEDVPQIETNYLRMLTFPNVQLLPLRDSKWTWKFDKTLLPSLCFPITECTLSANGSQYWLFQPSFPDGLTSFFFLLVPRVLANAKSILKSF